MQAQPIFSRTILIPDRRIRLSAAISIEIVPPNDKTCKQIILYNMGILVRVVKFSDLTARRLLIADACEFGAKKSSLAKALHISRTTIDNILKTKDIFGIEGLIHQYNYRISKDRSTQRKLHAKALSAKRHPVASKRKPVKTDSCIVNTTANSNDGMDDEMLVVNPTGHDISACNEYMKIDSTSTTPECKPEIELAEHKEVYFNTNDQLISINSNAIILEDHANFSNDVSLASHNNSHDSNADVTVLKKQDLSSGDQELFVFSHESAGKTHEIPAEQQPFAENHDFFRTRYAGKILVLITLISEFSWLRLITENYGMLYQIMMVFFFISAGGIASIEQMKNTSSREAGVALGIRTIINRHKLWKLFHPAAQLKLAGSMLKYFFKHQVENCSINRNILFVDGHTIPYTGKELVHSGFSTQRGIPIPASTGMMACDCSGKVVDFEIQEGKGDLRGYIANIGRKWKSFTKQMTLYVFDREGHGNNFFCGLVRDGIAFITWEKGCDRKLLAEIDESKYTINFKHNNKDYATFEETKVITEINDDGSKGKYEATLRFIYLWNKSRKLKTCVIGWTGDMTITTEDCARAILNRWGASENTFKHMINRHDWHYNPCFEFEESECQDIANPEIKVVTKKIDQLTKKLNKSYKLLSKTKVVMNADNTLRKNSVRDRLQRSITEDQNELSKLKEDKKQLPLRVDISTTGSEKRFKRIVRHGKEMYDLATMPVWNARKIMVEWLSSHYHDKNDVVDLLYKIISCHGWVKSTPTEIIVIIEPLEQPKRRLAQEQLCRKLTSLVARTPNGKRFVVEVGDDPKKKCPQK
jgi:hypothetical protein